MATSHPPHDQRFIEQGGRSYGIDYQAQREWGTFKAGSYLLPVDSTERDRLDVMHTLLKTARPDSHQLTHAPTDALTRPTGGYHGGGTGPRVLDLGCGTGLWMLQMAEKFPQAEYHGVDINFMLPKTILDNIVPEIPFDIESPWNLGWANWDIIHAQLLLGSINSWSYLFEQAKRHLVPGGWFESVEIDWKPRCDDPNATMNVNPEHSGLMEWWDRVSRAYRLANRTLSFDPSIEQVLEAQGFKDIRHFKYKIPLCGWHMTDPVLHRVGGWWNIAMSEGTSDEGCHGLEAMTLRPMTEIERWSALDVRRLCRKALDEASDIRVPSYNELHIVIARNPWLNGT